MRGRGSRVRGLAVLGAVAALGLGPATPALATALPPEPLCAIGDLQPIHVPTPSPLPEHKPGQISIGGDALAGNGLAVAPDAPPLPTNLAATSWVVADLDTGEVIGACGAHRMVAPASVQKVLLAATVMPKLNPADTVLVTPEDLDFGAEWDSKTVPLQPGQTYTVDDLFLGLMLRSGNDAANALARIAGGERGVAGTIDDMNAEARRLGAWDTHAATPSGLDGPGQVTSAYDLALIFRTAYADEDFRRWVRTPEHMLSSQLLIEHDNWEYLQYPGSLGGKAGFTDIARHSYVGAMERDGRRLVATVLGAEIMPLRAWQQTAALLDWGFAQPSGTSVGHLVEPGEAEELLRAREREPQEPVAVGPFGTFSTGSPAVALWLAAGIGAAAVASVAIMVAAGRRRRRRATAASTSAGALASAPAETLASTPAAAPASAPGEPPASAPLVNLTPPATPAADPPTVDLPPPTEPN